MKKKRIVDHKKILFFASGMFISAFLISFFRYIFYSNQQIGISSDVLYNIVSIQITISLLSITIMELMLENIDERIMGISRKYIFFNNDILKYFNAIDCIYYMLWLMIISIFSTVVLFNIDYAFIKTMSKCLVLLSLVVTIPLMFRMIKLGLISKHKKSTIYYWFDHRLKENIINKKFNRQPYGKMTYALNTWLGDLKGTEDMHNQYIIEEFVVLARLYLCMEAEEKSDENKNIIIEIVKFLVKKYPGDNGLLNKISTEISIEKDKNIIIEIIKLIVKKDPRDNKYLLNKVLTEISLEIDETELMNKIEDFVKICSEEDPKKSGEDLDEHDNTSIDRK